MSRHLSAVVFAVLVPAAFSLAHAQDRVARLDPLLRRFESAATVSRLNALSSLEQAGPALGMPKDQLVLSRQPGRFETFVDVFVSMTGRDASLIAALGGLVRVRAGSLYGARVPVSALSQLVQDPRVRYVQAARVIKVTNDNAVTDMGVTSIRSRVGSTFSGATGAGVIVGLVDTGLDLTHPDFKNADGTTRVLYSWDESDDATGPAPGTITSGHAFSHGSECAAAKINAGTCAEQDLFGHGTHVMGSAAGNGAATGNGQPAYQYAGVAPNASLIIVKGTTSPSGGSFSSLNIIEGVEYIFERAVQLGRPAVINLSLGGTFGPHDGTDPEEQAIDSLAGPGRIVVIAAGNSGSNQNNVGPGQNSLFLTHATSTLVQGASTSFSLTVPTYTPNAGTFNDVAGITMWYDGRDSATVTVTRPNGTSFSRGTGAVAATNDDLNGQIFIDNASAGISGQNGDNQVEIELLDANAAQPPASGTWTVTVRMDHRHGNGRFDAWLYFSFFGAGAASPITGGGDNGTLVGSPGTAAAAITVAAYSTRSTWNSLAGNGFGFIVRPQVGDLATFSSGGPARPLRDAPAIAKPDISAPGTAIFSSMSSQASFASALTALDGRHVIEQGTSMATPMITGTVALLLGKNNALTPTQVRTLLASTARSDGFTTNSFTTPSGNAVAAGLPNASWGSGKVNAASAYAATTSSLLISKGPRNDSIGGPFVLPRAGIPAVQLRLNGSASDAITITRVKLHSTGSGNEATGVTSVSLYNDVDSNGAITGADALLGTVTIGADDGYADFTGLTQGLASGGTLYLLASYSLNATSTNGKTFTLALDSAAHVVAQKVSDASAVGFNALRIAGSQVRAQAIGTVAAASGGALVSGTGGTGQPNVVLLRLNATADVSEGFSLRRFVGTLGGTANPATTLTNVRLFADANGNGVVDAADTLAGTIAATVSGASLAVSFAAGSAPLAPVNATRKWLVVADVLGNAPVGTTVSLRVDSLAGHGAVTDSSYAASGLPVSGTSVSIVQTTLAISGPTVDTAVVLASAPGLPLSRVRFVVAGESLTVDSLRYRTTSNLAASALRNIRLIADLDSNGVQGGGEPVIASNLVISSGVIRVVPGAGGALPSGPRWWVLLADGTDSAGWGQTIQARLDTADVFTHGRASGQPPVRSGAATVTSRLFRIGGQATLTISNGPKPPTAALKIGANPVLQLVVSASLLESARLDSLHLLALSPVAYGPLVSQLAVYLDPTGAGVVPNTAPLATTTNPFAGNTTSASLTGLNLNVPAGGAQTLLVVANVTNSIQQATALNFAQGPLNGVGLLSTLPANVFGAVVTSLLQPASVLDSGEVAVMSENPVRSGRLIFSYQATPRAISLYSFAGLRVRRFTNLPPNRYVWDLRGESPGVPNGMYIVEIESAAQTIRRRLMILSPAR